jgi:hypothetical protein
MVGLPGERVSNMSPPTVALAAHAVWLVGLAVLIRAPVSRWLQDRRVWTVVVGANGVVMTTFLWHLTALFAGHAVLVAGDLPMPATGSGGWWLSRPLWIALLALGTAALVSIFRGAEGLRRAAVTGGGAASLAGLAAAGTCLGILGIALTGLDGVLAGRSITMFAIPMTAAGGLALTATGWLVLRYGASLR